MFIWGHKLHSHTHSYVHHAFYRAFQHIGYKTLWLDDNDDVSDVDFPNSLFIVEGRVDKKIPFREDCNYVLHNCTNPKYNALPKYNRCYLQVYTDDVLKRPEAVEIASCIHFDIVGRCLYMPWATDLLPSEIDQNKPAVKKSNKSRSIFWVGTIGGGYFGNLSEIEPFKKACKENGVIFIQKSGVSDEANLNLMQNSYMAPTIVGEWQKNVGYVPCRIFKNISYGLMGVTNSKRVYELFERKIVYNADTYQLFYDAQKRLNTMQQDEVIELMDFVKEKHTYVNRINTILEFMDLVEQAYGPEGT